MLKRSSTVAFLLITVITLAAFADSHEDGNQTKCPIMGGDINKEVYTDYEGQRVFFCCPGCIEGFMKDPETHLKKMADEGVVIQKLKEQSVCPVSGEELANKETFVDVEGKRVYLCCAGCGEKVKADPEKYFKVIAERGEYLEEVE